MSKHYKEKKSRFDSSVWRFIVVATVVATAVIGAFAIWHVLSVQNGSSQEQGDHSINEIVDSNANSGSSNPSLPFSLHGVPADAEIIELDGDVEPIVLNNEWEFGGDYSKIASFPIDASTVFGSFSNSPSNSSSYAASLIHSNGSVTEMEALNSDAEYAWEPQDGTGNAAMVVWRSSSLSYTPFSGSDNWRLQVWSSETDESIVLGSAEELNNTDETPMLDAEIVPTFNSDQAFFASMKRNAGSWSPTVLAYELSGEGEDPIEIGEGSYPAATDDGVLWAGDLYERDGAFAYHGLYQWNDRDSDQVFSLSSASNAWSISGVWAYGSLRVVSFSSSNLSDGSYIGIWSGDFSSCLAWIHTSASRVLASMNNEWLVWGSGSDYENPGMYALEFESGEIRRLGSAVGYSRPAIAANNNTVLVPECDGVNAAVFHIGSIG